MQQTSIYILAATWAVSAAFVLLGQTGQPGGAPEKPRVILNTLLWRILLLVLAGAVLAVVMAIDQHHANEVAKCAHHKFAAAHAGLCKDLAQQAGLTKHQRTELNQLAALLLAVFAAAAIRSSYRALADGAGELPRSKALDRKAYSMLAIAASCVATVFVSLLLVTLLTDDVGDASTTMQWIFFATGIALLVLTVFAAVAATMIEQESETLDYGAQRRLGRALEQFGGSWIQLKVRPSKLSPIDNIEPMVLPAFRSGGDWYLRPRDADRLVHYHWLAARNVNEPSHALLQNQLELWPYWRYLELHVVQMEWFNRRERAWATLKRLFTVARRRRRDAGDELVNRTRMVRVDGAMLNSAGLKAVTNRYR